MRADIDGDGIADVAFTFFGRPTDCNYLVVDSSSRGRLSVRVARQDLDDPLPPGVPFVLALAHIAATPGSAIVVTTHEGATTGFAGFYLVAPGGLQRVRLRGSGITNTLPYGGSLLDYDGIDCVGKPNSALIASDAMHWIGRGRWEFERTVYRLTGTRLLKAGHRIARVRRRPKDFALPLFGRCSPSSEVAPVG